MRRFVYSIVKTDFKHQKSSLVKPLYFKFLSTTTKDDGNPPINSTFSSEKWTWIPPRKSTENNDIIKEDDNLIPIIPK